MSELDFAKITAAANAVMQALSDLSAEERQRVLDSAAALYGFGAGTPPSRRAERTDAEDEHSPSAQDKTAKQQSIVEFLKQKEPATNAQRIACFAYYREHVENKPRFARNDLSPYFAAAKLPNPDRNFARDFSKAVSEGWVHEDGANSYLTQGGEDAVDAGFGGKAKPRGSAVATRKGKRTKPTAAP